MYRHVLKYRLPIALIALIGLFIAALSGVAWFATELEGGFIAAMVSSSLAFPAGPFVVLLLAVMSLRLVEPVVADAGWIAWAGCALAAVWLVKDVVVAALLVIDPRFASDASQQTIYAVVRVASAVPLAAIVVALFLLARHGARSGDSVPLGAPSQALAVGQGQAPAQRPVWQASEATGGAWARAGDAATGAGASSTGVPGQASQGWQPAQPPVAAQPPVQQQPVQHTQGGWISAGQAAQGMPQPEADGQTSAGQAPHSMPQWRPVDPPQR